MRAVGRATGNLYSKGVGLFGALGHNHLNDCDTFQKVFLPEEQNIKSVSAGRGHSAAICEDDSLLIFGRPFDFVALLRLSRIYNMSPAVGRVIGGMTSAFGDNSGLIMLPEPVAGVSNVASVHCSAGLTVGLTCDGKVFSFGVNKFGQCGLNSQLFHVYQPNWMKGLPDSIISVEVGLQHCVALSESGQVWCWGKGIKGQLGDADATTSHIPLLVDLPDAVTKISAGFNHTVAITVTGNLYVWGKGMSLDPKEIVGKYLKKFTVYHNQLEPRHIPLPFGRRAVDVVSSNFASCIKLDDGTLYAIGLGEENTNSIVEAAGVEEEVDDATYAAVLSGEHEPLGLAKLPPTSRLVKGHDRVTVLHDTGHISQLVLYDGTPYLQAMDPGFADGLEGDSVASESADGSSSTSSPVIIRSLSQGWQHTLAVV